jgi:hypothetical protein
MGSLLHGYYDEKTGVPTVDINTAAPGYSGMWHKHPRGSDSGDLWGHVDQLEKQNLKIVYTSVGHDLYKQQLVGGQVLPAWNDRAWPPINALCKGCIP